MWGSIFNQHWWNSVIYRLVYRSCRLDWCSWHPGRHHHSWYHWWHHGWHLRKEYEKCMWTANFLPTLHTGRGRHALREVKAHLVRCILQSLITVWTSHPKTSTDTPFISLSHTGGASGPIRQHYCNHINDLWLDSCSRLRMLVCYTWKLPRNVQIIFHPIIKIIK